MGERSWIDRALAVAGVDEPDTATSKLRSLRRLLLLTLACEAWFALRYVPYSSHPGAFGLVAAAFVALLGLGWADRWARLATGLAGILLFGVIVSVRLRSPSA